MAALTIRSVTNWLRQDAAGQCTPDELHALYPLLSDAESAAEARVQQQTAARARLDALARESGFADVASFLRSTVPGAMPEAGQATGRVAVPSRRPYFDPLDSNPVLTALTHCKPENRPDWVKKRLEEGWDLEELHYKKHRLALKSRGITPLYDSIEKYEELSSKTAAFRRVKKRK